MTNPVLMIVQAMSVFVLFFFKGRRTSYRDASIKDEGTGYASGYGGASPSSCIDG